MTDSHSNMWFLEPCQDTYLQKTERMGCTQVNQGMKQHLSKGRGSNTGGRQLSTTSLTGNKYWKYKLWRFGRQFLRPKEVPGFLDEAHASLVTSNHISKNQSEKTCHACGLKGHKKTDAVCLLNTKESIIVKRERLARKANDARDLDVLTNDEGSKGGGLAAALERDKVKRAKVVE